MDSKQISEAMRLKLPVIYDGITYLWIHEYILWYDRNGNRQTCVSLMDKNKNCTVRAPAHLVELAADEKGDEKQ